MKFAPTAMARWNAWTVLPGRVPLAPPCPMTHGRSVGKLCRHKPGVRAAYQLGCNCVYCQGPEQSVRQQGCDAACKVYCYEPESEAEGLVLALPWLRIRGQNCRLAMLG